MPTCQALPLSATRFLPFGVVLDVAGEGVPANEGRARRHDAPVDFAARDPRATRLALAVYRVAASKLPFTLRALERHPLSPQLFQSRGAGRFLACACPSAPDGTPDVAGLRAFIGAPGQGFVWQAGGWHAPLVALDGEGDFLMQQWQCDGSQDCGEWALAAPASIHV
jgi:ureidoglycolate lyase